MSYQFNISDIGLRLIKAYEGFWPEPRAIASGGFVVGFGHLLQDGEDTNLTEEEAEELLKADLAPIEDLVNSRVHASMSQSQFDALCSLVFSIGEKAFLSSTMLHSLNKGQVIEASSGFDLWRMSSIGGKVYVIDALVRRRTAEKALFLRPTQRIARAPRFELTAVNDVSGDVALSFTPEPSVEVGKAEESIFEPEPVRRELSASDTNVIYSDVVIDDSIDSAQPAVENIVEADFAPENSDEAVVPISVTSSQPDIIGTIGHEDIPPVRVEPEPEIAEETKLPTSPIAAAAAEVSDRLDALIDETPQNTKEQDDWPDSLITSSIAPQSTQPSERPADVVIDELNQDDALREQIARESQYNTDRYNEYVDVDDNNGGSIWSFAAMTVVGIILALGGLIINLRGSAVILGENGPFLTVAAMLVGALLIAVGLLYIAKSLFSRN